MSALPSPFKAHYRNWRRRLELKFAPKESIGETFERIYRTGAWGAGGAPSSGAGSAGPWADAFVEEVEALVAACGYATALDIGCGDFSVGARICRNFQTYWAVDVSENIIAENARRYAEARNVRFLTRDACRDPLPAAELVLVRQVLQHLTNAQISAMIERIAGLSPRLVVFAEDVARGAQGRPNVDLPRQSEHTRAIYGSGVRLDLPPFGLPVELRRRVAGASPADEFLIWTWAGASGR